MRGRANLFELSSPCFARKLALLPSPGKRDEEPYAAFASPAPTSAKIS